MQGYDFLIGFDYVEYQRFPELFAKSYMDVKQAGLGFEDGEFRGGSIEYRV